MRAAWLAVAVLGASCVVEPPFECRSSAQCLGADGQGVCEPTGFCSFVDPSCPSGRRYGELAGGGLAGACAGDPVVDDGDAGAEATCVNEGCGINEICAGEACTCLAQIDTGSEHTCALEVDGSVWCWGLNRNGALGDGTTENRLVPTQVDGLSGVLEIAGGEFHTCARRVDGTVWCWGNGVGIGGEGAPDALAPERIDGVSDAVELDLGEFHGCAREGDGTVWCFGSDAAGQIGDDDDEPMRRARRVKGLPDAVDLAVGGDHACALTVGGEVWCWGKNENGQLADGTTEDREKPFRVDAFAGAVEVAAGGEHTCIRRVDDSIWCAGSNDRGQLGSGSVGGESGAPLRVVGLPAARVAQLVAGDWHTCVRTQDGGVICWGSNDRGQLGVGTVGGQSGSAGGAVASLPRAIDLRLGERHTCARAVDGAAYCWGDDENGQLGVGTGGAPTGAPRRVTFTCP